MPQTKIKTKSLDRVLNSQFALTEAEQQHQQMWSALGISSEVASEKHRLLSLDLASPAFARIFNSMKEMREAEKTMEGFADKLKAPVLMGLPLDVFGGSTFIPGTGPIPVYTVKSGSLFAQWGLGGHSTMTRLAITLKTELQSKQEGAPTPYLDYLKAALDYSGALDSDEDLQELVNQAAEAPHVLGLPAALEAASGRGTPQGVLMFNPKRKLDTSMTIPHLQGNDWLIYDLGRAIASETSSSRRAHGVVHQAMVRAMGQDDSLYVSYRVSRGVRKSLTEFQQSLTSN